MKKILIADDQSLNQTLLSSYLIRYADTYDESIDVKTADNGLAALDMCRSEPFDIIFMDILMPEMDGIEATRHINALLPHAIIVIVSTEGDEENQIRALRNGAKDYFVKPIQPDVFKHRLKLYMTMLHSFKAAPSPKQSANLFTKSVFCHHTVYRIENEEDLAQLWESILLKFKECVRTNDLSDLIRFLYQTGLTMLSYRVQPKIIIEENESYFFFSIFNTHILPGKKLVHLIERYFRSAEYLFDANQFCFKLDKWYTSEQAVCGYVETTPMPRNYEKGEEALFVYDFMDDEDLQILESRLNELSTQFIWMGSNELEPHDVDQIVHAFEKIAAVMIFYSETQSLGMAINDLSNVIKKDESTFIQMAPQMSMLCNGFNNDLITWFKQVFFEGAPSTDFMDASILSNIHMIRSFLEPLDTAADDDNGFELF